jgi:hypothetical protein
LFSFGFFFGFFFGNLFINLLQFCFLLGKVFCYFIGSFFFSFVCGSFSSSSLIGSSFLGFLFFFESFLLFI